MPVFFTILVATVAVLLLAAAGFVLGMRRKSGLVQRPIIWLARNGFNRATLRTAGRAGTATAIVRHTGRVSGRVFETPVDVVADGDSFLVALPYGRRSQWLRNVLAAGGAEVVFDGATHVVAEPRVEPLAPVAAAFAEGDRRAFRVFNVTEALRVRRVSSLPVALDAATGRRTAA